MKRPRFRRLFAGILALVAVTYVAAAVALALRDDAVPVLRTALAPVETIAIFGASGTAGDGILKAALADPGIRSIEVITRRSTPRMLAGVASGKVQVTRHFDYLDYAAVHERIAEADAVYWAIGLSSFGVDEPTYARIHVDFPAQFLREWLTVSRKPAVSFHYISSSDISAESTAMWAREKYRAERTLEALAHGTKLRVVLYRPDYVGPTPEEAHLGQKLLYAFFAPIGAAVPAESIGRAMLEASVRDEEFNNGTTLGTLAIRRYADAHRQRQSAPRQ